MSTRKTAMQAALAKLNEIESQHPYKVKGDHSTYTEYNEGWSAACDIIEQALTELLPTERENIEQAYKQGEADNENYFFSLGSPEPNASDYYDKTYRDGKD